MIITSVLMCNFKKCRNGALRLWYNSRKRFDTLIDKIYYNSALRLWYKNTN